jgi:hypothetical protein
MNKRCLLGRLASGAFTAALAITVLGLPAPAPARAQGFPERAVRIIVPTAPGARSIPRRGWSRASSPSCGASPW